MSVAAVVQGIHYEIAGRGYGSPCWIWMRGTSAGRPIARQNGKNRNAYRVAWEQHYGETLNDSLVLKRRCEQSLCVNPEHCLVQPRRLDKPRRLYLERNQQFPSQP